MMSFTYLDKIGSHAHWLLRISIASVFIYHGVGKFPQLEMMSNMLGLPVPVMAFVAIAETLGGLAILIAPLLKSLNDIVTRGSAFLLAPIMVVAIGMVHWGQWSFVASETHPMGGMEFQFTLLMTLIYFILKGKDA